MNNTEQIKKEALKKSLKYQLMHKVVSLLTQQQMKEKAQKEIAELSMSRITAENKEPLQYTPDLSI